MIDTHSHINFEEYKPDFENFLNDIKSAGVEKVIIPGVEPSTFGEIIELCNKYDMLYGALGVHPSEYTSYTNETEEIIKRLAQNEKIVAIGEIGLDYHYGADSKEEQKILLRKQLQTAHELNLPVIIHDRESHEDVFEIINEYQLKDVIFHCFSGDADFALKCLNNGYYIALGGVVTFKNALELKEAVKVIPLDKLLLETDAPYLAPVPFRGKLNSPVYLKYIAEEIARIKNIDAEIVKNVTSENAKRVFNIK